MESIARDDERLRETAVAIGYRILEPRPVRSARSLKEVQETLGEIQALGLDSTVTLEGAQVLIDAEEHIGPGPRARKCGHGRQRRVEQIASETVTAGIAGTADHGAERPQRAPMAVVRSARFEPLPRIRQKVSETAGPSVECMADKGEIPGRKCTNHQWIIQPPSSRSVMSNSARALSSRQY